MVGKLSSKLSMELMKFFYKKILKKKAPGFWNPSRSDMSVENISTLFLDLRNTNHAHLGDQLFFIAAFIGYHQKKVVFLINESLIEFYSCFDVVYAHDYPSLIDERSLYICSLKSYIDPTDEFYSQFQNKLVYDLTDSRINLPLYRHIFEVLVGETEFSDKHTQVNVFSTSETKKVLSEVGLLGVRFYAFNDFLYSRAFLRPFLQGALREKLEQVKNDGYIICYLGGKADAPLHSRLMDYVDIDLRGKTSFRQLLAIIGSDNCAGYIGFDNALMHMHLLYRKPVFVKFRGRVTSKARSLHLNSINCAMNSQAKGNIVYLKPVCMSTTFFRE